MVKRLIFDVDNTLILWKEEYSSTLENLAVKYQVEEHYPIISKIVCSKKPYDVLTKEALLQDINTSCNINLPITFIDELIEGQKHNAANPDDFDLQETIQYLSTKYELYVLSNWYTEAQSGRLERAKVREYFKAIYGGDAIKMKPSLEAFMMVMQNNPASEYMMIGDSIDEDIKPALSLGMKAIIVDLKDKVNEPQKVKVIKNIKELMDIL